MSYGEQLRGIANEYYKTHRAPATTKDIAVWAVRNGLWHPQQSDVIDRCAEELSRAMREEHMIDPQGRSVRAKHVARVKDGGGQTRFVWADIRTAPLRFMQVAFQQRRQQIIGDCRQLKTDVDSYNENAKPEKPIQIVFDFTRDLEELEQQDSAA
ncbi:MAG: hypothetical protein WA208_12335 [Thermoanaerobaculia bacterium]